MPNRNSALPFFAALLAGTVLACPLPATADDAGTIASCLEVERAAERDGRSCIGRISKPCIEAPGGETTAGMKMCTNREIEAWDAQLNAEYQRLLGVLEGETAEKIRGAQRAWITMRDGDCALSYTTFEGGTIAGVIACNCLLERTATRALQLHDLRTSNGFE
jgi:uncharacterized protein YecT (DUF1311 family)